MSDDNDNRNRASTSSNQNVPTNNPLFGAPPPPSASTSTSTNIPPQPPLNDAGPSSSNVTDATSNPIYGASPSRDDLPWHTSSEHYHPTPRELRLYHPPRNVSSPPSKTLQFIRRLTFILSLVLGLSSAIAGIWSIFILPLLHSSFSARKALVSQQSERVSKLLEGIRKLRELGIYPPSRTISEVGAEQSGGEGEKGLLKREEASVKEISSSVSSLHSEPPHPPTHDEDNLELIPTTPLTALSARLKVLSSSMDATSTTRTSVISTLEGYTSSIHHQLFLSRSATGGMSSYGVNMNSLSAHLNGNARNGGKQQGMGLGLGEEWDNTRKEIRAIKGMLLNRRQFSGTK